MIKEKLPLVFILDSDTTNPNEIEKKKSIIDDYLSPFGANRYKIFMFSPEIETIFFTNPKAIETFFGISISDKSLLYNPKEYLNHLCMNKNITYEYFLNNIKNLDENALNDLRENNTIKEILNSLPHI